MSQRDSKYVSSNRPINSRTTAKPASPSALTNPLLQERLAALKLKNRFGIPLSEQLHAARRPRGLTRLHPVMLIGGIVTAISALGVALAAIQGSTSLAVYTGIGVLLGIGILYVGRRTQVPATSDAIGNFPLFSEPDLQKFDHALEQATLEVPENIAKCLIELKQQVLRIAQLAGNVGTDENFTLDDKHYVSQCLSRYLPDSLQSYLRVPSTVRDTQAIEGELSATDLLLKQIVLIQSELGKREARLNKNAAAQLVRQQRFLEAKNRE